MSSCGCVVVVVCLHNAAVPYLGIGLMYAVLKKCRYFLDTEFGQLLLRSQSLQVKVSQSPLKVNVKSKLYFFRIPQQGKTTWNV